MHQAVLSVLDVPSFKENVIRLTISCLIGKKQGSLDFNLSHMLELMQAKYMLSSEVPLSRSVWKIGFDLSVALVIALQGLKCLYLLRSLLTCLPTQPKHSCSTWYVYFTSWLYCMPLILSPSPVCPDFLFLPCSHISSCANHKPFLLLQKVLSYKIDICRSKIREEKVKKKNPASWKKGTTGYWSTVSPSFK